MVSVLLLDGSLGGLLILHVLLALLLKTNAIGRFLGSGGLAGGNLVSDLLILEELSLHLLSLLGSLAIFLGLGVISLSLLEVPIDRLVGVSALSIVTDELVPHQVDHLVLLRAHGEGSALLLSVAVAQNVVGAEVSGVLVSEPVVITELFLVLCVGILDPAKLQLLLGDLILVGLLLVRQVLDGLLAVDGLLLTLLLPLVNERHVIGTELVGDCAGTAFQSCSGGSLLVFIDVVDITGPDTDGVEVVTVGDSLPNSEGLLLLHLFQLSLLDGFVALELHPLGLDLVVFELLTVLLDDGVPFVLRQIQS